MEKIKRIFAQLDGTTLEAYEYKLDQEYKKKKEIYEKHKEVHERKKNEPAYDPYAEMEMDSEPNPSFEVPFKEVVKKFKKEKEVYQKTKEEIVWAKGLDEVMVIETQKEIAYLKAINEGKVPEPKEMNTLSRRINITKEGPNQKKPSQGRVAKILS